MSRSKGALQLETPASDQPQGRDEVAPRARQFHVGDPIPLVLTIQELAVNLRISERTLLTLRKAGTHPAIKQLDMPGDPKFDGRTFKTWLDDREAGEPVRRHFFGAARKPKR